MLSQTLYGNCVGRSMGSCNQGFSYRVSIPNVGIISCSRETPTRRYSTMAVALLPEMRNHQTPTSSSHCHTHPIEAQTHPLQSQRRGHSNVEIEVTLSHAELVVNLLVLPAPTLRTLTTPLVSCVCSLRESCVLTPSLPRAFSLPERLRSIHAWSRPKDCLLKVRTIVQT